MKLINKLMPLASCLALGATVAPISLTSCANSGFVDLKDDYLPTITKADGSSYGYELTEEDALSVYVNAINENPQRFIDDANWTFASALNSIAVNPYVQSLDAYLIPDSEYVGYSSTLNYAKQKVSNVKMSKTTFLWYDTELEKPEWEEKTVPTISFDLEREQKFTYIYPVSTSWVAVSYKTEAISTVNFKVENLPILLNGYTEEEELLNSNPSNKDDDDDEYIEAHLGRYLMYPDFWNRLTCLIPSYWTMNIDSSSLSWMVDPWSITYENKIDDKDTISYLDVTETETWTNTYSGSFTTWEDMEELRNEDEATYMQLANFSVKSYYLSDIATKEAA